MPDQHVSYRQALGRWGERRAERWYLRHGYTVLERNWRCGRGELDVIVRRGATVVFCEVKTRSSLDYGMPAEAVGFDKQRRIRQLAAQWLELQPRLCSWQTRFDVVEVMGREIRVIEGAF
ncbi:MAG: YraN family protein [Acidimicrobiia bacterium]|nr:YraN family protein [Acidimicrobiia bacterium]MYC57498.1 YraN family protein [Acidimicrobiia bacterium]MYG93724.1 YraN family protein [Acidimicrobiia bacterium]MYI30214.1 YraN family protein [Acidimicrobiia bacterium]